MAHAQNGDTVNVHYTGTFDDGEVFDSSDGNEPLQFTIGNDNMIPVLEKALIGMNPGETKTGRILAEEAYGSRDQNLLFAVERNIFAEHQEPMIGQYWRFRKDDGQTINVKVEGISDQIVVMDGNHPFAGKDLNFTIELITIV